jgi:hypothetical protein
VFGFGVGAAETMVHWNGPLVASRGADREIAYLEGQIANISSQRDELSEIPGVEDPALNFLDAKIHARQQEIQAIADHRPHAASENQMWGEIAGVGAIAAFGTAALINGIRYSLHKKRSSQR